MNKTELATAIAQAWDDFEGEVGEAPEDDEMAHIAAAVALSAKRNPLDEPGWPCSRCYWWGVLLGSLAASLVWFAAVVL